MIKNLKNPVVILDVDEGCFIECNDLALEFFQLSKKEILKKSPFELSPSHVYGHEAEAYSRQVIQEALAGANPVFDWIHKDKDGLEIPCEIRLIRFPPYNKQLVRGTIIDKRLDNSAITRESEERLRLTLESANIGTYDWYLKTDKLAWDEGLFSIFELDPTENIDLNAHFFHLLHPDDKERVEKEFGHSLAPNGPNKYQIEYRIKVNGKVKHLLANSRMIRDKDGEVIRMIGTTQDITKLRESEKKLRENEELLDSIIQDQKEMIVRWKPGGFRTFVNKAYCEMFDLDPKEAIGKSFFPRLEKSFLKKFKEDIKKLTRKNPVRTYRINSQLPNGKKAWQEWSDRAYFDGKGNPVEYQSVGRDITSLIESEEQLKKNENLFRSIVQDQAEMIVRWKGDGVRTFANRAYLEMFDLKEEEVIGSSFYDLIDDEDLPWVKKEFEQLNPENPTRSKMHKVKLPDGSVGWQEWIDRAFFDNDGKVKEYQSVGRDVTEIIAARKSLEESERRYRDVFNQQFQFSALLDMDGRIVQINDLPLEVQGIGKEDFIGKYFWKAPGFAGNKKYEQRVREQLNKLLESGEPLMVEEKYDTPDGKTRYATSHYSLIKNSEGDVENILVQAIDKTEIIEAQKALEESEARYRNVFNQQFQFTALLDLEGRVVLINDLPLKIQGLSREDYTGKLFWESPGWKGNEEWEKKVKSQVLFTKKTGEPLIVEDPYYGADKEVRWAKAAYSTIQSSDGKIENILVQAIDITIEKDAKKEIEERERKLSLIYGNTNDFILLIRCDKNGYFIEEINDSCIQLLDLFNLDIPKEKLIGVSMHEVYEDLLQFPQEKVTERVKAFDFIKNRREPVSYQQEMKTNKGFLITSVDVVPVIQEGQVTHLLMVAKDITETFLGQKKLEEAYKEVNKLKAQLEQENIYLKEEIKQANDFENMVFSSKEFRNVLNKVEQVANTDATVLITGETGTGKELIARAIHNVSMRSEKPMIKVNAAAIPKDLIESELFGYEKGAFTGATSAKPGKFELADGGSIFLDEIGDMPMDLQVKILRVLQESEVERLGSTNPKKINIRIITATNRNLEAAIKEGKFREDLYFRLNVFPIEIPPLRSRPDDVPILVKHFISKYNAKHSKSISAISKSVMNYMRNYAWPGNVRELENIVERAVILSPAESLELPEIVDSEKTKDKWEHDNALDVIQENHIRKVLSECHWKIEGDDGAAAQLKINPSTLRDKMKKFNIKRPK